MFKLSSIFLIGLLKYKDTFHLIWWKARAGKLKPYILAKRGVMCYGEVKRGL